MRIDELQQHRLIHLEAELREVAFRVQPASFAQIGITTYDRPVRLQDGSVRKETVCLLDTQASMANRLEALCWDDNAEFVSEPKARAAGDVCSVLAGLPYVRVTDRAGVLKLTSLHGYHRIATDYVIEAKVGEKTIADMLLENAGLKPASGNTRSYLQPGDMARVYKAVFDLDPLSLVHGFWMSQHVAGLIRVPRALCAETTATIAQEVTVPGTKFDTFKPDPKKKTGNEDDDSDDDGKGRQGKGTVPHQHSEVVPESITATFIIDLNQLCSYGLKAEQTQLLLQLCLWKIRRFLNSHLRLRSNCILECPNEPKVLRPSSGFTLPSERDLDQAVRDAIVGCKFGDNPVTVAVNEEL